MQSQAPFLTVQSKENPQSSVFCAEKSFASQRKTWSASSLRAYMTCPRLYQYRVVEQWDNTQGELNLSFGKIYHAALETFDRSMTLTSKGSSEVWTPVLQALRKALELTETLDPETGETKFFGGQYLPVWLCTNTARGKKACPYRKPQLGEAPNDLCGHCGSPLHQETRWIPQDKYKNRETLIRTVLEYCDTQPRDGSLKPYVMPNGEAAVEVGFLYPLPLVSPDGDPYMLEGYFDSFFQFGQEVAPKERKTTKSTPGKFYFDRYEPDVQIDTYDLTANLLFPHLHPPGVLMEAAQTAVGFSRVERKFITIPAGRREEWFQEVQMWIKRAELDAAAGYYPKNTAACSANGGCMFRDVCRRAPESRAHALATNYTKRPPREERQ